MSIDSIKHIWVIVEDQDIDFQVFQICFDTACHQTEHKISLIRTKNGEDFFDLINNNYISFCLVFLDINLPGTNGIEILRQIRTFMIPCLVIMISTSTIREEIEESYKIGCTGFIKKYSDPDNMIKCLKQIIYFYENVVLLD